MMWDAHEGMGWWMIWGSVFWLFLVVAIIFLLARVIPGHGHDPSPPPPSLPLRQETPLEVAKRRYAAGEISRDEYEQLRHDLT
jgi:putative membrane protein